MLYRTAVDDYDYQCEIISVPEGKKVGTLDAKKFGSFQFLDANRVLCQSAKKLYVLNIQTGETEFSAPLNKMYIGPFVPIDNGTKVAYYYDPSPC